MVTAQNLNISTIADFTAMPAILGISVACELCLDPDIGLVLRIDDYALYR